MNDEQGLIAQLHANFTRPLAPCLVAVALAACGDADGGADLAMNGVAGAGGTTGAGAGRDRPDEPEKFTELWYSVDQLLVRIAIGGSDASTISFVPSAIVGRMEIGHDAITMLSDGSLLGARLSDVDAQTHFYHVPNPPRDGSDVSPVQLGIMPDGIKLESLYTDCDGQVYGMDTGVDELSPVGDRLLRFTGDVIASDFNFVVVTDLSIGAADIDDLGPGITNDRISDNPGLAIDTGNIHRMNYETGAGSEVGKGGTWGIHALGGALFEDGVTRLYVLSSDAHLFAVDPRTFASPTALGVGPKAEEGYAGWSGLTGPLTDCVSGFAAK